MASLLEALKWIGIVGVGVLIRLALTLLVVAALAAPILGVLWVWRHVVERRARWRDAAAAQAQGWRPGLHYAPGHAWVRRGRRKATIGIDAVAARLVPDVDGVELPGVGDVLRRGQPAARLRCGHKLATVLAPMDGVVTRVNVALRRNPALVAEDPYGRGWLYRAESAGTEPGLAGGERARVWLCGEGERLTHWLEADLGLAAADGGEPVRAAAAMVTGESWTALTEAFLRGREAGTKEPSPLSHPIH